jgi:hypothetical protein
VHKLRKAIEDISAADHARCEQFSNIKKLNLDPEQAVKVEYGSFIFAKAGKTAKLKFLMAGAGRLDTLREWAPKHELLKFTVIIEPRPKFKDIKLTDFMEVVADVLDDTEVMESVPHPVVWPLESNPSRLQ